MPIEERSDLRWQVVGWPAAVHQHGHRRAVGLRIGSSGDLCCDRVVRIMDPRWAVTARTGPFRADHEDCGVAGVDRFVESVLPLRPGDEVVAVTEDLS